MADTLRISSVVLRVRDLGASVAFYEGTLGFVVRDRAPGRAVLAPSADAAPLLELRESPGLRPADPAAAGLFHAALLLPSRAALGGWLAGAAQRALPIDGVADHGVSEAIYFSDPDGNGLEFYRDRPRTDWPRAGGELAMTTERLDVRGLLAEAGTAGPAPLAGARWGHLHLRVTQLERSEAFYRSTLGLDVMQRSFPGARFLAADGYHHHLGLNVWGQPRRPQPSDTAGLVEATIAWAGTATERSVTDPDGIRLRLEPLAQD